MLGGSNGPPIYNGAAYSHASKTLLQLRTDMMIRLGYAAQLAVPPPGMTLLLNHFLADAQEQMYLRYSPLRNVRWWPISVVQGERFYDIPSISSGELTDVAFNNNDPLVDTVVRSTGSWIDTGFAPGMVLTVDGSEFNDGLSISVGAVTDLILTLANAGVVTNETVGTATTLTTVNYKSLDERRIKEAWVLDDTVWSEMKDGIDSGRFNETGQSFPQEYEFREFMEIWPIPDQTYTIWLKGHFGLMPFESDTDVTTIDSKLVFLMALATAKNHYGQNDAGTIFRQLEVSLKKLNKEDFGNKRYIPKSKKPAAMAEPKTTFARG